MIFSTTVLVPEVAAQWGPIPQRWFLPVVKPRQHRGHESPQQAVTRLRHPGRLPRRFCDSPAN